MWDGVSDEWRHCVGGSLGRSNIATGGSVGATHVMKHPNALLLRRMLRPWEATRPDRPCVTFTTSLT